MVILTSGDVAKICMQLDINIETDKRKAFVEKVNDELYARYGDIEQCHDIIFRLCNLKGGGKALNKYILESKKIFDEKGKFNADRPNDL